MSQEGRPITSPGIPNMCLPAKTHPKQCSTLGLQKCLLNSSDNTLQHLLLVTWSFIPTGLAWVLRTERKCWVAQKPANPVLCGCLGPPLSPSGCDRCRTPGSSPQGLLLCTGVLPGTSGPLGIGCHSCLLIPTFCDSVSPDCGLADSEALGGSRPRRTTRGCWKVWIHVFYLDLQACALRAALQNPGAHTHTHTRKQYNYFFRLPVHWDYLWIMCLLFLVTIPWTKRHLLETNTILQIFEGYLIEISLFTIG